MFTLQRTVRPGYLVGACSIAVVTTRTRCGAGSRDHALGKASRGRCGGTCGWRNQGGGRGRGKAEAGVGAAAP